MSEELHLERKEGGACARKFNYKVGNPWLCNDRRDEYENCIAGNREGLTILRDAIEEALENGEGMISLHFSDFSGVVRVEGDPRETEPIQKNTFWRWIGAIFYAVFGLTLMGLIMGGGIMLILNLFKLARNFFH